MHLRRMNPLEHKARVNREHQDGHGWDDWDFPDTPRFPLKPLHPDKDIFFRTRPREKVKNSDAIVAYLKSTGDLKFSTGDTRPSYLGATDGVYLNRAQAGDPEFTISKENGPKNLCVTTGYRAPYGRKIRIPKGAIVQGYPMNEYSDHKLHIFDVDRREMIEIQFVVDTTANPVVSALLNFLALLRIGKGAGGLQCHGVTVYSLDENSTSPAVRGSTAANIPNAETCFRYDDTLNGWMQMTTMAVSHGKRKEFVYPAEDTDGPSDDPNAVKFGQVLKLTEEGHRKLLQIAGDDIILRTIVASWYEFGIMVVDTGGNNSTGVEIDNRWANTNLRKLAAAVSFDLFEVWEW
jgi:hypothetical protein